MHASSASNSDSSGEEDYDPYDHPRHGFGFLEVRGSGIRLPEDRVRAHQLFRGTVSTKRVASKTALASLQTVQISDLPSGDRSKLVTTLSECSRN